MLLALLTSSNVKPVCVVVVAGLPVLSLYPAGENVSLRVAIFYAPNTFAPVACSLAVVLTGLTPL